MDIHALRAFLAVKETGSFSQAGEQLFLTQPAISKRIAALELDLGTRLFDRVGKKVLLTEAGQELYTRAKSILLELEDCRRVIANLTESLSGTVSFGTSHHIGLHRLPPILKSFSIQYPQVDLDIHFMDSEKACSALSDGLVELALATLPESTTPAFTKQLVTVPVWQDPLVPVISKQSHLFSSTAPEQKITPTELASYPAILPGHGTYTRNLIETAFSKRDVQLEVKLATNNFETIRMLIGVGLGWGFLPTSMVKNTEDTFCQLQVDEIKIKRTLGVIRHRQRSLSNGAQALLARIVPKT